MLQKIKRYRTHHLNKFFKIAIYVITGLIIGLSISIVIALKIAMLPTPFVNKITKPECVSVLYPLLNNDLNKPLYSDIIISSATIADKKLHSFNAD